MKNQNLTSYEIELLKGICNSDYYDEKNAVWDFSVLDYVDIPKRSTSGVVSSLVKKQMIEVNEWNVNEFSYKITESGYKLLRSLSLVDKEGYWIA